MAGVTLQEMQFIDGGRIYWDGVFRRGILKNPGLYPNWMLPIAVGVDWSVLRFDREVDRRLVADLEIFNPM